MPSFAIEVNGWRREAAAMPLVLVALFGTSLYALAAATRVLGRRASDFSEDSRSIERWLWLIASVALFIVSSLAWARAGAAVTRQYARWRRKLASSLTRNAARLAAWLGWSALATLLGASLGAASAINLYEQLIISLVLFIVALPLTLMASLDYYALLRRPPPIFQRPSDEGVVVVEIGGSDASALPTNDYQQLSSEDEASDFF